MEIEDSKKGEIRLVLSKKPVQCGFRKAGSVYHLRIEGEKDVAFCFSRQVEVGRFEEPQTVRGSKSNQCLISPGERF